MGNNVIYELSKKFAIRIIKLYVFLKEEKHEFVMSKQIYRCGTSIGANIAESTYAQSTPDYISKLSISLKEASETLILAGLTSRKQLYNNRTIRINIQ